MKTDTFGDTVSFNYYGGLDTDIANCIRETNDGGYILAGSTWSYSAGSSDLYLIRTNSLGDTLWTNSFGGEEADYGESVDVTDDGGFIITGQTRSFGHLNIYVVRTDALGDSLWTYVLYGAEMDNSYAVQQTDDGGFIVGGGTESFSTTGGNNMVLIRFEPDYNPIVSDLTINIHNEDVILSWRNVPQLFFREYRVYRSDMPYFDVTGMIPISVQTENSFVDPGAAGERYFYRVTVVY